MTSIIKDINKFNTQLKSNAESHEWDKVKELTEKRHCLLQNYFEKNNPDKNELISIQSTLIECDNNIQKEMTEYKNSNIKSSIDLRNSYKAVSKYRTTHNATANG